MRIVEVKCWLNVTAMAVSVTLAGAAEAPLVKLRQVPFSEVTIRDSFWAPRRETNRTASIPFSLQKLEEAGNMDNLRLAARGATNGFHGPVFMDSDLHKAIESAAYSLATNPDPALDKSLDEVIELLAAAQQPDGYLDSYFIVNGPGKRWTNLRDWHELYCAGHLFEAAVAHYQATGKTNLLRVATRLADHIDSVFGPAPKKLGYPGHPEIELALVKLWRATGNSRYLKLAQFFIENRGRHFFASEHGTSTAKYDGTYWQDDVPIYDHSNIKGHAVRAGYLMSGATDVAAQTGDARLLKMLDRVWRNTIERNEYLTGGIGPSASNEGFTEDYDLPNLTAYQETCASVALALWAHRMALAYEDAKYADVLERCLYNGVISGVSLDGMRFFYVNPLESNGTHHRQPWFGCACCPPNVTRTLAALGGYAYAVSGRSLVVNLYIQGSVKAEAGGTPVVLEVKTDYPWDGKVVLRPVPASPAHFAFKLRVPGWCRQVGLLMNGTRTEKPETVRGYITLEREWKAGDEIELYLPMPVERVAANPNVKADRGLTALQRGPLVYCLEACDQEAPLSEIYLPLDSELVTAKEPELLGGVVTLRGRGRVAANAVSWRHRLYQPVAAGRSVEIKAIPYYAWDNRQAGPMKVWLPSSPPAPMRSGLSAEASVSVSFANNNSQPSGINDGIEPRNSAEQPVALCHWWPHKGTTEWAQYEWKQAVTVNGAEVYWFDDTGRGECRLPASWKIEYRESGGGEWKAVKALNEYEVAKDRWCKVKFELVTGTALRLVVAMVPDFAAGVHEWKVIEADEEN